MDDLGLARELQQFPGLLEFASSTGILSDFQHPSNRTGAAPLLPPEQHVAHHHQHHPQAAYLGRGVGHEHDAEQEERQQGALVNAAAENAVSRALSALQASRRSLCQLVSAPSNARSTPLASSSEGGKPKRKSARTATDQSAGRGPGKGLRHFSMKVCEKVQSKGRTTYEKVANELVTEMSKGEPGTFDAVQYDEKNIRRRVYDAINVLLAMGIIEKEKKEIIWKGFPEASGSNIEMMRSERQERIAELERKQAYLQELIEQQQALQQLLQRNPEQPPSEGGTALHLPFILVQAKPDATVEVKISDDMLHVQFDFYNSPFQIHDDSFVLRNMSLHAAAAPKALLPPMPECTHATSPHLSLQTASNSNQDSTLAQHSVVHPSPAHLQVPSYHMASHFYQPAVAAGYGMSM